MVLIPGWSKNGLSSESLTDLPQVTRALLPASLLWFPLAIQAMAWNPQWGQSDSSVSLSSEQNWLRLQLTSRAWHGTAVTASKRSHRGRADAVPLLCSGNLPINSFFSNNFPYVKKANPSFCTFELFCIILAGLKSVRESEAISGNTAHITSWNPGSCSPEPSDTSTCVWACTHTHTHVLSHMPTCTNNLAHSHTLIHIHLHTKLKYTHTFPHTQIRTTHTVTVRHPQTHIYMRMHDHVHPLTQMYTLTYTHHTHANVHTWLLPSLLDANTSMASSIPKALVAWELRQDNVHGLFRYFQISTHSALWTSKCLAEANFSLRFPLSGDRQLVIPTHLFPPRQSSGNVRAIINRLHDRR